MNNCKALRRGFWCGFGMENRNFMLILCLWGILWGVSAVQAQAVHLELFITPNPSPYVSDWKITPNLVYIDISSNSPQPLEVILETEIIGQRYGQVLQGNSLPISVPGGGQVIRVQSPDLVDWENVSYNPQLEEQIGRSGRIPEDDYQICVRALEVPGNALLGETCLGFSIFSPEPPALILPPDEEIVEDVYPTFQWSAVQVPPGHDVNYHLKIVPLQEGQPPQDAIESNIPHHEVDLINQTLYPYPPDALPFEAGTHYVWQVQALDDAGFPLGENQGMSEIWQFLFQPGAPPVPSPSPAEEYVVCLFGAYYHVLPRTICEGLGGTTDTAVAPNLDFLLPDSISPTPFGLLWGEFPPPILPPAPEPPVIALQVTPMPDLMLQSVVAARFDARRVPDTTWQPIGTDENGRDGWGVEWAIDELEPGFYEVRVRAVDQENQMAESSVFTAQLHRPEDKMHPFLWGMGTEFVQNWEQGNQQLQQQIAAQLEPTEEWRRERAGKAADYQTVTAKVNALKQIDAGLNPVAPTFRPKIRKLMAALKQIRTPPTPADIDQAVKDAQARLDACRDKLKRLKQEQKDLEKEKKDIKKRLNELLGKLDDLFRQHGYKGGYGFHRDGTAWYGYVSAGPGIQYGTPAYTQYRDLTSQIHNLKKRTKAVANRLKELPGQIKDAEEECKKLEEELKKLKEVKSRKDLNEKKLQECWRQVRSTLQPLINWCAAHPSDCTFKAELDQLAQNCPVDEDGWNQFWNDFSRIKRAKEQLERALTQQARKIKKEIDDLDRRIRKAEQEAERKRREAEQRARAAAAAAAAAQAAREHQRYLLNNIKELGLITYPGFWETPGIWDWLPSILQVPVGSFLEDRAGIPIPTDVIKAIGGLYNIIGALLDPCTALGMRKTVERLQERINPKTGHKYTLDEALDKTEQMCQLLRKLKALAQKAQKGRK